VNWCKENKKIKKKKKNLNSGLISSCKTKLIHTYERYSFERINYSKVKIINPAFLSYIDIFPV